MVQIIVSCLNFKNLPKYSTGICSKTIQQCSQKSQLEMEDPVDGDTSSADDGRIFWKVEVQCACISVSYCQKERI